MGKMILLSFPLMLRWTGLLLLAVGLLIPYRIWAVGTWTNVVQAVPNGNQVDHVLLLSDGTVMAQQTGTTSNWFRLTPDIYGSYINGSWTNLAPMNYSRQFYSSAVLRDGRVFVAGGEIVSQVANPGGNTAEVYDPTNNLWTVIPVPPGLICTNCNGPGFSDSDCMILSNGTVMIAPVQPAGGNGNGNGTVIFDPRSDSLSPGPAYLQSQNEASWVKLPDGSIITIDATQNTNPPNTSERFIPSLNHGQGGWIPDGIVPVAMYNAAQEMGAALLLPDGRAFFIGGLGHTAFYTPSGNTNIGAWDPGPDVPGSGVGWDTPAAMLVNGKVFFTLNCSPVCYYEFDPNAKPLTTANAFRSPADWNDFSGNMHNMLDLPDGNVLVSYGGGNPRIYIPDGVPVSSGKPAITSISVNGDGSYHLTGTGLNGISQGSSFGDDSQMDSNFPIIRLTDVFGFVYFARTYNWSSTGVRTGNTPVTTEFTVPTSVSGGIYSLVVVANGISSDPVSFPGPVWVDFNYNGSLQLGDYSYPFSTLRQGTNAVASGGVIAIKPGSSPETMTINKPMTIVAAGGPATIGR
jgi:hypothetical protein